MNPNASSSREAKDSGRSVVYAGIRLRLGESYSVNIKVERNHCVNSEKQKLNMPLMPIIVTILIIALIEVIMFIIVFVIIIIHKCFRIIRPLGLKSFNCDLPT